MTLGRCSNAADGLDDHEDRRRVTGCCIIDDLGNRQRFVTFVGQRRVFGQGFRPRRRFVGRVETQVVVDRLGCQHTGKTFGERLQAVECPVATDGDQAVDSQSCDSRGDRIDVGRIGTVEIGSRGTENCPAPAGIQFGNDGKQGVQRNVRQVGSEQTTEAVEYPQHLDFQLVGPNHGSVERGIQCRRVTTGGEDGESFHRIRRKQET